MPLKVRFGFETKSKEKELEDEEMDCDEVEVITDSGSEGNSIPDDLPEGKVFYFVSVLGKDTFSMRISQ